MCKQREATDYSPFALAYGNDKEDYDACDECNKECKDIRF